MSAKKKPPKIGDRLRVVWWDFTNHTNSTLAEAKPSRCWTEGRLAREAEKFIVIQTSQYIDHNGEPEDCGDYTIIIRGGIESIKKI
jgi:hypothetical protein